MRSPGPTAIGRGFYATGQDSDGPVTAPSVTVRLKADTTSVNGAQSPNPEP
jgi:hypothetical protein